MTTFDERSAHTVYEKDEAYSVEIADEVVTVIAGLAATEAEGVASLAGGITHDVIGRLDAKNLSKAVRVEMKETDVTVDTAVTLEPGAGIPETAEKVQEKVRDAIENMTGMRVEQVNVRIAGVRFQ